MPRISVNGYEIEINEAGWKNFWNSIACGKKEPPAIIFQETPDPSFKKKEMQKRVMKIVSPLIGVNTNGIFARVGEYIPEKHTVLIFAGFYPKEYYEDIKKLKNRLVHTVAHELGHAYATHHIITSVPAKTHNAMVHMIELAIKNTVLIQIILAAVVAPGITSAVLRAITAPTPFNLLVLTGMLVMLPLYCLLFPIFSAFVFAETRELMTDILAEDILKNYAGELDRIITVNKI
ncbi:MAG: hypothetical protein Q7R73_00655 [bacterium]|nr:hypothetical protein [bacterium]